MLGNVIRFHCWNNEIHNERDPIQIQNGFVMPLIHSQVLHNFPDKIFPCSDFVPPVLKLHSLLGLIKRFIPKNVVVNHTLPEVA